MDNTGFTVTFVRHGETDHNKNNIMQTFTDVPLNETGYTQANLLGKKLKDFHFTKVYSSDMIRTQETAKCILSNSEYSQTLSVILDPRVQERNFGELEGQNGLIWVKKAIEWSKKERKSILQYDLEDRAAESYKEFVSRIFSFFDEIDGKPGENILVVSHGLWIMTLMELLTIQADRFDFHTSLDNMKERLRESMKNTAVTTIKIIKNSNSKTNIELLTCSDISHLS